MQVLNYQSDAISQKKSAIFTQSQASAINPLISESPSNQIINDTIDAINQTLQQIVDKAKENILTEKLSSHHSFEDEWNILYFLRLLFYIVVILKILELVFNKRKKIDIKERVYRKYVFSYAEMIRQFDDEDRSIMNTTLKNTIKNASIDKNQPKMVKKMTTKKVMFYQTKNEYIEPVKTEQQAMNRKSALQPSQMFLTRPEKIEPLNQPANEQVDIFEKQFTILETIKEKTNQIIGECQSRTILQHQEKEFSISQSTNEQSLIKEQ